MKRVRFEKSSLRLGSLFAATALFLTVTGLAAQEENVQGLIDRGEQSYRVHCASCHGIEANGDGMLAQYLKVQPPDLTLISNRNEGVFPFDQVYEAVEGREVPGHGTRAMPVWGPALQGMTGETDKKVVKEKIVELVYYLKSLQPPDLMVHPKMGGGAS